MAKQADPSSKNSQRRAKAAARAEAAAKAKAEREARERRARLVKIGAVVVAMVLIVGVGFALSRTIDTGEPGAPAAGESDYGLAIGEPDAPHQVVIYEDFLCPFCGDLERATGDRLAELAEDGQVYLDYRPFKLLDTDYSEQSANAFAVVLEESGPEVAKEFHDLLFADQPSESGSQPDADWLVDKAVEAGAEEDAVRAGIEGMEQADWVEGATAEARDSGVTGTPTVLLDGERFQDGRTIDDIADNLIEAIQ